MGNGNSQGLPMGMFANQYRISEPSESNAQSQVHGLPVAGLKIDAQKMPADVLPVLDHFKKVFGYDMTQLKQGQFQHVLAIIQVYEPVYENTDVVPTPDAFLTQVRMFFGQGGLDGASLVANSAIAYKYFYNETKPGEKSDKSASVASIMAGGTEEGGQSWGDWISSLFSAENVKTATDTAGQASETVSATASSVATDTKPMATSAADYMSSVAPAGTPLPAVTTPGSAPKPGSASVITPANPVPDWSSYSNNLTSLAESATLATTPSYAPVAEQTPA